jgi:hypothetical protein
MEFGGDHVTPVHFGHLGVGDFRLDRIRHKVTVEDDKDTDRDPNQNCPDLAPFKKIQRGGGLQPGVDLDDTASLVDRMEASDDSHPR